MLHDALSFYIQHKKRVFTHEATLYLVAVDASLVVDFLLSHLNTFQFYQGCMPLKTYNLLLFYVSYAYFYFLC